ncbi:hypothetical protein V7793_13340 [Streptomyces sp. KLMMK]|uniref:hypothetical protein n=1 Tax=Streptomyces sp. KLMMK TaxID=3109353 RepID=UPI00300A3BAA
MAAYVAARPAAAPACYTFHATVPADADAETVRARTYALPDRVRPLDETTSTLDLAADNPHHIAEQLLGIGLGPLAHRLLRAARALTGPDHQSEERTEPGTRHRH